MRGSVAVLIVAGMVAGCSGAGATSPDSTSATTPTPKSTPTSIPTTAGTPTAAPALSSSPDASPAPSMAVIEGKFDVGGHELYLRCVGSGSPTIVYFHGYSQDPASGLSSTSAARGLPSILSKRYRFCGYDRANVGSSDDVPGLLTGETSLKDLHALLAAAKVEPPYVLLGASFGGLLSYLYAVTYPKEVVGMVLLDAAFPGELDLEPLWPAEDRWTHDEFKTTDEKLDQLAAYEQARDLAGKEPAIPVTYLLAMPSGWTGDAGDPVPAAYKAVVLERLAEYVHRFTPGVIVEVKSQHWMEYAVPDKIAQELDKIVEQAR